MRVENRKADCAVTVCQHLSLLGHRGYGVTELRTFDNRPMVAYVDNELNAVRLCRQVDGHVSGIYTGVQPRPVHLFDKTPNCWRLATSSPESNCACDTDIEYITACFWDIDVVSARRNEGHPASEEELQRSYRAAQLLCRQEGLASNSVICCSGNGHYVLAPVVPVPVYGDEEAMKFRYLCRQLADKIVTQVAGVRIDPVFNLSRLMRVVGTVNRKGQAVPKRPYRRAYFVTAPTPARSVALHYMILGTEIPVSPVERNYPLNRIRCDLLKIETCEFIKWCRKYPAQVSEPQWFALITNLAPLNGGPELIHEISRLDVCRYDRQKTERLITRVLARGYSHVTCERIKSLGFNCGKLGRCYAKAPIYTTDLFTVWK
jgi:hypothetical protein